MALDVTVITPIQDDLLHKAAAEGGAAARNAHHSKLSKYHNKCAEAGIDFIPLPVETWGGWYSEAYKVIKQLSNQLARHLGNDETTPPRHTFQRLGVLLQRGNVALLSSRIPEYVTPEIDSEMDADGD